MEENPQSFAELFSQKETKKLRHLSPGQKVSATIVGISGESVFLDIGGKSEGVINASELLSKEGTMLAGLGDTIDVYYLQSRSAEQIFTTKVGAGSNTAQFEEAWRSGIPVSGLVKAEIKGGFEITLGGSTRAFCPYSQMGLRRLADPAAEYLGTTMIFRISRFSENGRNIVLSARALQEEEQQEKREQLKEQLAEGQTVEGTVTSIREFGIFIDIGGVDGLIPASEIGWSRVDNFADAFQVGQQVKAVIKKLDWQNNRFSLSYKETQPDPWAEVGGLFPEGSIHEGMVARLTPFGAFVTLGPGIDGLIHISKLGGGRRINHPREVLEQGQNVAVKVESIDAAERRISLAPADYVSPESKDETERQEFSAYTKTAGKKESEQAVGSLGAMLQAKLAAKNKK